MRPGRIFCAWAEEATLDLSLLVPAVVFIWAALGVAPGQAAAPSCAPVVGNLVSVEGMVEVQRTGAPRWSEAGRDDGLCEGDSIRAGERSRAAIALVNDAVLRLDERTTIRLLDITAEPEQRSFLGLVRGAVQSFSRKPRMLSINTPYLNATIEGTEFALSAGETGTDIILFSGSVVAANDQGKVRIESGEAASAAPGQPPQSRLVVRPRDAVSWALFYPPAFSVGAGGDWPAELRPAAAAAGRGDTVAAFADLERVAPAARGARFHLLRAALLLDVGRVDEASAELDLAVRQDPDLGSAYALRSVIETVGNRPKQARAAADRAVTLQPEAAAPLIALSYADQAEFDLPAARSALERAVINEPQNGLAWARLAELRLMQGERNGARAAAERASELDPKLARTQIARGFAALSSFRTGEAKRAFAEAIDRDAADPLPWLGQGLARIREGDLRAGRRDIEIATGLNGNSAILHAYLGKAYFEENRTALAAEQFAIATELDPNDPTAFLYDGILLQTRNQPVAALSQIDRSIALNDNRAVYRSRLALDADRAARQTSLARVYNDLGFTQLGQNQSTQSLALDPGNGSAHRFLSDTYLSVRRREISRVSELLQAQMLQDVNLNPVQPSISETNLNIVSRGGPGDAGFNEFTPMFERNGAQLNVTGLVGNDNTYGGEAVVSGLYDRFSVSGGGFYYDTDGWRTNNDLNHKIGSFFAQAAVTPKLNIQGEFRHRDSEFGDLPFNFDRNAFIRDENNEQTVDMARVGLRYSPSANADVLVSFIHSERDEKRKQTIPFADPVLGAIDIENKARVDDDANQIETAGIYRWDRVNLTGGFGYYDVQRDVRIATAFAGEPLPDFRQKPDISDYRGYLYTNVVYPETVTWTLGASIDRYREDDFDVDKLNPKVGARWAVTPDVSLRAAYFRVVKPPLVANRTLEPTQIAGFNQFFDDINGTASTRWGLGADWAVTRTLSVGAEATWRTFDEPTTVISETGSTTTDTESGDEELHRLYAYWTPFERWAFSTGLSYDKYKIDRFEGDPLPEEVETITAPLNVTYFHPGGLFAGGGVSYVHQKVDRLPEFSNQGSSTFAVVDVGAGYRLANRRGIASVSVRNLFDSAFQYQDDSYREFRDEPYVGPYFPERTFVARVNLNF
ncbi:MAG: TonB-dependent receptor [Rhodospirillales bacterium]|nr:TonB-dependent receptor [Rhodospirillales bacterium]